MNPFELSPIGIFHSPYQEKFTTPRQSQLVPACVGEVILPNTPFNYQATEEMKAGQFFWLLFIFHLHTQYTPSAKVRPPRLGGNKKMGVYNTRSSFRPNSLGMSLLEFKKKLIQKHFIKLQFLSPDIIEGTPILDIKPYSFESDRPHKENQHFWADKIETSPLQVRWNSDLSLPCEYQKTVIEQTLALAPRPSYHKDSDREYKVNLFHFEISFQIYSSYVFITNLALK